jgi:hypothetical protein
VAVVGPLGVLRDIRPIAVLLTDTLHHIDAAARALEAAWQTRCPRSGRYRTRTEIDALFTGGSRDNESGRRGSPLGAAPQWVPRRLGQFLVNAPFLFS